MEGRGEREREREGQVTDNREEGSEMPLPVPPQQEQSGYAGLGRAAVRDHVQELAVVVRRVVRYEHGGAPGLLHCSGLVDKGAAPAHGHAPG